MPIYKHRVVTRACAQSSPNSSIVCDLWACKWSLVASKPNVLSIRNEMVSHWENHGQLKCIWESPPGVWFPPHPPIHTQGAQGWWTPQWPPTSTTAECMWDLNKKSSSPAEPCLECAHPEICEYVCVVPNHYKNSIDLRKVKGTKKNWCAKFFNCGYMYIHTYINIFWPEKKKCEEALGQCWGTEMVTVIILVDMEIFWFIVLA